MSREGTPAPEKRLSGLRNQTPEPEPEVEVEREREAAGRGPSTSASSNATEDSSAGPQKKGAIVVEQRARGEKGRKWRRWIRGKF